jgi:two-component system cell cycle sensor histidine kinase/response regulator CckA
LSEHTDAGSQIAEVPSDSSPEELRRLRLAVEASGEVIFMTDPQGTVTYVNPEFVRVYGYTPGELIGRATPRILKSGSTSADDYDAFWQQLRGGQVVKREFVNRRKDGTTVQIEGSANPIVMNDNVVGFLAVQRDVTARKATEAALRESEARYRALAEAAHDSIFIVDSDGRIEYANAVSLERFRIGSDPAGKRLVDVFPPAAAGEMSKELSAVFSTGRRQYFEGRFETPAGDLWMGAWLVPLARGSDQTAAVMGVARDITERKRLEREFAQAQKMEAIGRLAGGVAHDFNNLLTAILGYADLLLGTVPGDSDVASDLREIRNAGERASRLTRQLLTFSRKQAFSPKIVNLNDVVGELQKMLNRILGEDIVLDVAMDPQLAVTNVDPGQIEQVLVNLVVNARDAMPRGGTIRIQTANADMDAAFCRRHDGARQGRYVALTVQDTGCGLTPEVLAHAFEPFFTTKPEGKGTGLGLSTVYGIVKQSGGYITIDSEPGLGTTFTTYLPVAQEAAQQAAGASRLPRPLSGTETILLVEDEPGLRRLVHRTLEQHGYSVLNAATAEDAVSIARRHTGPIHLLLSDVIMPGLSGPDLAQRLVRLRPSIRVLYVSGYTSQAVEGTGAVSPHARFLSKPFSPSVLATKVRECLDAPPALAEAS